MQRAAILLNFFGAVFTIKALLPFYFLKLDISKNLSLVNKKNISVLYANIYGGNLELDALAQVISFQRADLIGLLELSPEVEEKLAPALSGYSHKILLPRLDHYGLGIYSSFPIINEPSSIAAIDSFGENLQPALMVVLDAPQGKFNFTLLHLSPPKDNHSLIRNTKLIRRIASEIRKRRSDMPQIVAGDFNAMPFSSFYKRFQEWTGLHNASLGYGLYKTWPADWLLPAINLTLDHIFISDDLTIADLQKISLPGSDHYGFLAKITMNQLF